MQGGETLKTYDTVTRWLHWGSAVLLVILFVLGLGIDWVPRGEPKIMVRSVHIALGTLLTLALVYRVVWRRLHGQKLDSPYEGLQAHAIQFFHGLLYLLMLAMVTSGIVAVWFRGVNMFDLFTIEPFDASNKPMRRLLVNIHEIIAYALMALASVHAMVALWHHYRLKDRVMQRMWPTLSQRNPLS